MNLIKYEAYKLFIKRRLLLILTVCIAAEAVTAYNSAEKAKIDNYESQQKYEYYISVYAGELTEEKQNEINSLIEKDESVADEKKQLVQSYVAREITDNEYEEKLKIFKMLPRTKPILSTNGHGTCYSAMRALILFSSFLSLFLWFCFPFTMKKAVQTV